jgi:hypothetical protein
MRLWESVCGGGVLGLAYRSRYVIQRVGLVNRVVRGAIFSALAVYRTSWGHALNRAD